jgi:hypothetical protein
MIFAIFLSLNRKFLDSHTTKEGVIASITPSSQTVDHYLEPPLGCKSGQNNFSIEFWRMHFNGNIQKHFFMKCIAKNKKMIILPPTISPCLWRNIERGTPPFYRLIFFRMAERQTFDQGSVLQNVLRT